MYTNSAYWHQTRLDFKDKKHPIFIGSCGTYRLYTIKKHGFFFYYSLIFVKTYGQSFRKYGENATISCLFS